MKEHSEAVVLEPLEPVTAAFDPLHTEVEALRGSVGRAALVVSEDLAFP